MPSSCNMTFSLAGALGHIIMTEGGGERVGHIGRVGQLGEAEFSLHGALDLLFRRSSVAGNRLLDARGIVADDRQPVLCRRQEKHAAGMPHQDGRARMLVMRVKLLHDDRLWPKLLNYLN